MPMPAWAVSAAGSTDATTILNSVLSAYGLPLLPKTKGFQSLDDFDDPYYLEYPRSWVQRSNSLRGGIYLSDFQTADSSPLSSCDTALTLVLMQPADSSPLSSCRQPLTAHPCPHADADAHPCHHADSCSSPLVIMQTADISSPLSIMQTADSSNPWHMQTADSSPWHHSDS
eukprot:gene29601-17878_t